VLHLIACPLELGTIVRATAAAEFADEVEGLVSHGGYPPFEFGDPSAGAFRRLRIDLRRATINVAQNPASRATLLLGPDSFDSARHRTPLDRNYPAIRMSSVLLHRWITRFG